MFVAAAVGDVGKVVAVELQAAVSLFPDVAFVLLAHGQLAFRGARVGHVDVHAVLVAVERNDSQFVGLRRELDAGHVAIGVERQFQGARHAVLDVEGHHRHVAVLGTGHGVFVAELAGILVVGLQGGVSSFVFLDGVDRHGRFVVAHPRQHFAVGGEVEAAAGGELLLVHPVGDAVEHLAPFAVLRDLAFGVAEEQFHHEEVAFAGKGDEVAVGREDGSLLGAAVGERLETVVGHVVDVVDRREGAAVNLLGLRAQQDAAFVGRHDVAVNAFQLGVSLGLFHIEDDTQFLAVLKRAAHDALAAVGELRIAFAVVQGVHAINILRVVGTHVVQRQLFFLSLCWLEVQGRTDGEQAGHKQKNFLHIDCDLSFLAVKICAKLRIYYDKVCRMPYLSLTSLRLHSLVTMRGPLRFRVMRRWPSCQNGEQNPCRLFFSPLLSAPTRE